jgi:hypothetical protein
VVLLLGGDNILVYIDGQHCNAVLVYRVNKVADNFKLRF